MAADLRAYFIASATTPLMAFLALAILGPPATAANPVWQSSAYNDPAEKGRYTARLMLQVPETDDARFSAVCQAGSSGTEIPTVFGYNTGRLKEGTPVTLEVKIDDFRQRFTGHVYGTKLEQGVSGILLNLDASSPFWGALASGAHLEYRAAGMATGRLSLKGSGTPVRKFVSDCNSIFGAMQQIADRAAAAGSKLTCKQFGKVRSQRSSQSLNVTFVNRSGQYRAIMWIDYKGQPVDYGGLNPGQSKTIKTYLTHPWMLTDGPGNCIEMFMPRDGVRRFDITVRSRGFGPE